MGRSVRARLHRLHEGVPAIVLGGAGLLVLGIAVGWALDVPVPVGSDAYVFGATLLLTVGLYGSTYTIDLKVLRADLRGVTVAVTLGVVLKAGLIAGTMMVLFRRPEDLVLGIAVAQIDPLSVAALVDRGRMSPRARSLLTAWASFDDPMTVLLTLYLAGHVHQAAGQGGSPGISRTVGGDYATALALDALLLAIVLMTRWAGRWTVARLPDARVSRRGREGCVALLIGAVLILGAMYQLMLGVALAGLLLRAKVLDKAVGRAIGGAFLLAFLTLGLLLAHGVRLWPGVVLGLAAFSAQAVVALGVIPLFVRGLERGDRIALGLGQQNGITAILIALTLERDFPGTVATVGPAVITANLVYGASQALLAYIPRRRRSRIRGEPVASGGRHPAYEWQARDERPVRYREYGVRSMQER